MKPSFIDKSIGVCILSESNDDRERKRERDVVKKGHRYKKESVKSESTQFLRHFSFENKYKWLNCANKIIPPNENPWQCDKLCCGIAMYIQWKRARDHVTVTAVLKSKIIEIVRWPKQISKYSNFCRRVTTTESFMNALQCAVYDSIRSASKFKNPKPDSQNILIWW